MQTGILTDWFSDMQQESIMLKQEQNIVNCNDAILDSQLKLKATCRALPQERVKSEENKWREED